PRSSMAWRARQLPPAPGSCGIVRIGWRGRRPREGAHGEKEAPAMPFDGMALAALAAHLRRRWLGARVTKVVQWDGDHMVLYVRHGRDEGRLHIALDPRTPAVWADTGPEAGDREGGRLHPSPFC